jgi:hypothetical protein
LWQRDLAFRAHFISILANAPFAAYKWETPPITTATADRDFEFVLLNSPALAQKPDVTAFSEQFRAAGGKSTVTFANLGKDATLVVPCPAGPADSYVHLGAFVRTAPSEQVHELWQAVGAAVESQISAKPIWLSTAGMGVSWLHVRLDTRPKYYGYEPYRDAAEVCPTKADFR